MNSPAFKKWLYIFLFFLSMPFIIYGIMFMRQQVFIVGSIILVLALGTFFYTVYQIEKRKITDEEATSLQQHLIPSILFFVTLNSSMLLYFNMREHIRTPELNHSATIEWLVSILSFSIAVFWFANWKFTHLQKYWNWIKSNRLEFYLLLFIVSAGFFIRVIYLTQHPYPWSGDETKIGLEATLFITGEKTNLFDIGWSGQPNVSFLPTLFSILTFGQTIFAVKIVSVVVGTFSILFLYLLAREWFGKEIAIIASAFLVAFPYHLQFSRIGVGNIFDSLVAPLVLWLIFRAVRTKNLITYLLAGIITGLALYLYVGTRLVLALAIASFICIAFTKKDFLKSNVLQLSIYFIALLITIHPIVQFFFKTPILFLTRIGQESIFNNNWLILQMENTGLTFWGILLDQFLNTLLVFFARDTGKNFLNFDRPYLTMLGSAFFLIGILYSLFRFRDVRQVVSQIWFWSVLILGGVLTLNPPANTRMVMTTPVTALFIALGAWQVSNILLNLNLKRNFVYGLNILLISLLAYQNLSFYFGYYWKERLFHDANGELAMEAGIRLQQLGENYDYYLFGLPEIDADFPTTVYLNPHNKFISLSPQSGSELPLDPTHGAFIVAIPEYEYVLQTIIEQYPNGTKETLMIKDKDIVLYYAYILSPAEITNP